MRSNYYELFGVLYCGQLSNNNFSISSQNLVRLKILNNLRLQRAFKMIKNGRRVISSKIYFIADTTIVDGEI